MSDAGCLHQKVKRHADGVHRCAACRAEFAASAPSAPEGEREPDAWAIEYMGNLMLDSIFTGDDARDRAEAEKARRDDRYGFAHERHAVPLYRATPPQAAPEATRGEPHPDTVLLDWLEDVLRDGNPACEIYLAGLRHRNGDDATAFQVEGSYADPEHPEPFETVNAPTLREALQLASRATPTPDAPREGDRDAR